MTRSSAPSSMATVGTPNSVHEPRHRVRWFAKREVLTEFVWAPFCFSLLRTGGEQASIYAAENFAQNLRSALRAGQSRDIPAALREAYRVTDEGFSAIATKVRDQGLGLCETADSC